MVSLPALWLPILLSAAAVFIVSSLVHMVLGYHASDMTGLPDEDAVAAALRAANVQVGAYALPHPSSMKEMSSPEFVQKMTDGPVALITVRRPGPPAMGRSLVAWFFFCLVVSVFAAYIAGVALPPGAGFWAAFRFTGAVAFVAYGLGQWTEAVWFARPTSVALKNTLDAVLYTVATGAVFGWLWPGT